METSPLKNGKPEQFHVGQYVSSFCADGESYRAKVVEVHAGDRYLVTFVGYDDSREVGASALQSIDYSTENWLEWGFPASGPPELNISVSVSTPSSQSVPSISVGDASPLSTNSCDSSSPEGSLPKSLSVSTGADSSKRALLSPRGQARSEEEKKVIRRLRVAKELLETERSYVESLNALVDVFITPLTAQESKDTSSTGGGGSRDSLVVAPGQRVLSKSVLGGSSTNLLQPSSKTQSASAAPGAKVNASDVLSAEKRTTLFSNIPLILDLNAKFLQQLDARISKWEQSSCIGDLFVQFAPFFKMYSQYVNNHGEAILLLNKLNSTDKYKKFQAFSANCSKDPRCKGLDLASFLIMPIQRIPRYKLLLQTIFDNTDKSHADHPNLTKALSLVGDVAVHINEAVRHQQNSAHIVQLQSQFAGDVNLVQAGRSFQRQGSLKKKSQKNGNDRRFEFFLFNDLLVFAEMSGLTLSIKSLKLGKGLYKLQAKIPIDHSFDIHDLPDRDKDVNRFMIVSSSKSFIVLAENDQEKKEWIRDIKACMDLRKNRLTITQNSGEKKESKDDKESKSACELCFKIFITFPKVLEPSFVCSQCDLLVCDACSKGRAIASTEVKLPPDTPHCRLCDACVKSAREKKEKEAAKAAADAAKATAELAKAAADAAKTAASDKSDKVEKPVEMPAAAPVEAKTTADLAAAAVARRKAGHVKSESRQAPPAVAEVMNSELQAALSKRSSMTPGGSGTPAAVAAFAAAVAAGAMPGHRRKPSMQKGCAMPDCAQPRVPPRAYCALHLSCESPRSGPGPAVSPKATATTAAADKDQDKDNPQRTADDQATFQAKRERLAHARGQSQTVMGARSRHSSPMPEKGKAPAWMTEIQGKLKPSPAVMAAALGAAAVAAAADKPAPAAAAAAAPSTAAGPDGPLPKRKAPPVPQRAHKPSVSFEPSVVSPEGDSGPHETGKKPADAAPHENGHGSSGFHKKQVSFGAFAGENLKGKDKGVEAKSSAAAAAAAAAADKAAAEEKEAPFQWLAPLPTFPCGIECQVFDFDPAAQPPWPSSDGSRVRTLVNVAVRAELPVPGGTASRRFARVTLDQGQSSFALYADAAADAQPVYRGWLVLQLGLS